MTPHELMRALICLVLLLPFAALVAHADPPPPELGVTVTRATDCATGCWRLVSLDYKDEHQSGGLHHAFAILRDEAGNQLAGAPWMVAWADGQTTVPSKPAPDWSDIALWACFSFPQERGAYTAYAGTDPARSDRVEGLGLPYCHHVTFWLVWQWEAEPREPLPPRLWLPIAGIP